MATTESQKLLETAQEQFEEGDQAWSDNFTDSKADIEFGRLGKQWPDDIEKQRKAENKPMLTLNRIPAHLRQVMNDARQNKPGIKVRPTEGGDKETAEVIQGLIRNIESTSDADVAYDTAVDNSCSAGIGFIRVDLDYAHNDTFDKDIVIKPVENIFSVTFDASTKAFDSSDWNYAFLSDMLPTKTFEQRYPKAEKIDFKSWDGKGEWFTEDSVRVAEWWYRTEYDRKILKLSNGLVVDEQALMAKPGVWQGLQGQGIKVAADRTVKAYKVCHRLITGAEVIEETDWAGTIIPLVPVYGEIVNLEGKRHWRSMFRDAKGAQIMNNVWRTASTEMVALAPKAPWVGPMKAFEGLEDIWANANTKNYGYLPYKGDIAPQRMAFDPAPAAHINEAQMAVDDFKDIIGQHDASLGIRSNETSGKAIMARQREGDVNSFHFMDNLVRSIRCVGRCVIELIPVVYDTERVVRTLGDDGKASQVTVNQKVLENGIEKTLRDVTKGKYDISVEAGPSFTTRRQEAQESMTGLVQANPEMAPILGDLIAKNSDWPDADKVATRLHALLPPQVLAAEQASQKQELNAEALAQQAASLAQKEQQLQQAAQQMTEAKAELEKQAGEIKNEKAALQVEKSAVEVAKKSALVDIQKASLSAAPKPEQPQQPGVAIQLDGMKEALAANQERSDQLAQTLMQAMIQAVNQMADSQNNMAQSFQGLTAAVMAPTEIVRDQKSGRAIGSQKRLN